MTTSDEATTNAGTNIPEWTLADRLRKSLDHAEVPATEMAEYLEVHRNTVSNWIYGHARPPASAIKLWAMRCGVPYKWLVYGDAKWAAGDSNPQPMDLAPELDERLTTAELKGQFLKEIRPTRRDRIGRPRIVTETTELEMNVR